MAKLFLGFIQLFLEQVIYHLVITPYAFNFIIHFQHIPPPTNLMLWLKEDVKKWFMASMHLWFPSWLGAPTNWCCQCISMCCMLWCCRNYKLLEMTLINAYFSFIVFMFFNLVFSITTITLRVRVKWSLSSFQPWVPTKVTPFVDICLL